MYTQTIKLLKHVGLKMAQNKFGLGHTGTCEIQRQPHYVGSIEHGASRLCSPAFCSRGDLTAEETGMEIHVGTLEAHGAAPPYTPPNGATTSATTLSGTASCRDLVMVIGVGGSQSNPIIK